MKTSDVAYLNSVNYPTRWWCLGREDGAVAIRQSVSESDSVLDHALDDTHVIFLWRMLMRSRPRETWADFNLAAYCFRRRHRLIRHPTTTIVTRPPSSPPPFLHRVALIGHQLVPILNVTSADAHFHSHQLLGASSFGSLAQRERSHRERTTSL